MLCWAISRFICTGVPSWWQLPQRKGIFSGATADCLSLTGTIAWFPWQLMQWGASGSPRAAALPCRDLAYRSASWLWHIPQLTLAGLPWGRLLTSRSAWQPVQPTLPWTEGENFLPSTNSETTFVPRFTVMPLSPWHAKQVSFCGAALFAQADAEDSSRAKATINAGRTARRPQAGKADRRREGV